MKNLADTLATWAAHEDSVLGLILIGSRARDQDYAVWRADQHSDWDFQVITTRPEIFDNDAWLRTAGVEPLLYVVRRAAIGGVPKIALVIDGAEADILILPAQLLTSAKQQVLAGAHHTSPELRSRLQDLTSVIRPSWKFYKGEADWADFYRIAEADVPDPRMSDDEARSLADAFVCDYVRTLRRLRRGELIAAQRLLHHELSETNIQLLHELRLRQGKRSFPQARRLERIAPADAQAIAVDAPLEEHALETAVELAASTCRRLMHDLVPTWRWPDLSAFTSRHDGADRTL